MLSGVFLPLAELIVRQGLHVRHVEEPRLLDRTWRDGPVRQLKQVRRLRDPRLCVGQHDAPVLTHDRHGRVVGVAESRGALGDRVEDGLDIRRRARDHTEDLGDGGLTLERLLRLVEQAHVLDRDRRLVGEARDELDLLRRERTDLVAAQRHHPDRLAVAQDRYAEQRTEAELRLELDECRIDPGFRQRVFDLCRDAVQDRAADDVPAIRAFHREAELEILLRLIEPEGGDRVVAAVRLEAEDHAALRSAEPRRRLEDAVEDGAELECRSADEPEDVRGRGLALERRRRFVEKTDVLDRDDRLVGECREELHLPVGEGAHLIAPHGDHADRLTLAQHRHAEDRPEAADTLGLGPGVFGIRQHVRDVHRPALERRAPDERRATRRDRILLHEFAVLSGRAVRRHEPVPVALEPEDESVLRLGQAGGVLDERVEHALEVEGGAADDLEDVTRRGLLVE